MCVYFLIPSLRLTRSRAFRNTQDTFSRNLRFRTSFVAVETMSGYQLRSRHQNGPDYDFNADYRHFETFVNDNIFILKILHNFDFKGGERSERRSRARDFGEAREGDTYHSPCDIYLLSYFHILKIRF